jgi:peptide/nickel transport system substrate-binding protein
LAFNQEKAKALLSQSKYENGAGFDLLVPVQPQLLDVRDAVVVMQSQLAEVGIQMNLKFLESVQVISTTFKGDHSATIFPVTGPVDPTYNIRIWYLPDQPGSKSSGYTNPALTAAVIESFRFNDPEALKPIYSKIQSILAEDSPHVWIGFVRMANLWRNEVKNFRVNTALTMLVRDVTL